MVDTELVAALHDFGVDPESRDALVLLPVVWVAWADGTLDPQERELILRLARERVHLGPQGARVLENWLSFVPERARVERAAALLVALDMRARTGAHGDIVDFCHQVATAAGGLFGRVSAPEREAMEGLARSLAVEPHLAFDTLRARLVVEAHSPVEEGWFDEETTNPLGGLRARPSEVPAPSPYGPAGVAWTDAGGSGHVVLAERITVGRGRGVDLQLSTDGQLSRAHAVFERRDDGVYLVDLGSLNGSFVNGERVKERRLFGGEVVRLGETQLRYRH